jgi:hypothetical protein
MLSRLIGCRLAQQNDGHNILKRTITVKLMNFYFVKIFTVGYNQLIGLLQPINWITTGFKIFQYSIYGFGYGSKTCCKLTLIVNIL